MVALRWYELRCRIQNPRDKVANLIFVHITERPAPTMPIRPDMKD